MLYGIFYNLRISEKIKIYTKYENQFFNYYALTNPIEDIAVSFEFFVKLGKENHFKNVFFFETPLFCDESITTKA